MMGPSRKVSRYRGRTIMEHVEGYFYFLEDFVNYPTFNTAWSAVVWRDEELSP